MAKQELEKVKFELRDVEKLIPYANNSRTHSEEQIQQVVNSIKEFGFINPVIVAKDGVIIAGHCRVLAAKRLGMKRVPCVLQSHLTPTQLRAYVIADNQLALNAGWDEETLAKELSAIQDDGFDLDLLGFNSEYVNDLLRNENEELKDTENNYTKKIEPPVYEPQMEEAPSIFSLCDKSKYKELCDKIDKSNCSDEVKDFLKLASARHLKFDYKTIAEFYAHADKETQELMEDNALVIIDFDKAIELGFVELSSRLQELMELQK